MNYRTSTERGNGHKTTHERRMVSRHPSGKVGDGGNGVATNTQGTGREEIKIKQMIPSISPIVPYGIRRQYETEDDTLAAFPAKEVKWC